MAGFYDIANAHTVFDAPLVILVSKKLAYGFGSLVSGLLDGEGPVVVELFAEGGICS